jgi:hypothetical protein
VRTCSKRTFPRFAIFLVEMRSPTKQLIAEIEELQTLLEDRATYQKLNQKVSASRYADLYAHLDVELERLGFEHENPHRQLDAIWSYSKLKGLDTYEERREHIRSLYDDVLFDLRRQAAQAADPAYWKKANDELQDELSPIRNQWLKAKNFIYSSPPDFENSIKESINSVESTLKILLHKPKSTLGQLVKRVDMDEYIRRLIAQAYGYASDMDSVRHGGTKAGELRAEDAEFFLNFAASCIIYLKARLVD